jgi:hypothetical protein
VYIPLQKFEHTAHAFVNDMESFLKLSEALHQHVVFRLPLNNEEYFGIIHNQMVYLVANSGFLSLEDATDSFGKEFKLAADYYEARDKGLSTMKELEEMRKTGATGREALRKLKQFGIFNEWDNFLKDTEKYKDKLPKNIDPDMLKSPEAVTEYALKNGWRDYKDFYYGFLNGFPDKDTSDKAQKTGFIYARDFYDALEKGFFTAREYEEAAFHGIDSKKEYDDFSQWNKKAGNDAFDETALIATIEATEDGKKLSISKVRELYKECLNNITEKYNGTLPKWFSCKLTDDALLINFLKEKPRLKEIGVFDEEGEFFQLTRLSNELILIDGSNVAYFEKKGEHSNKPHTANIIKVVKMLHEMRYKNIVVIADASLKHKLNDWKEKSGELLKLAKYSEAPAQTTADEFLISRAKEERCRIVTNDTFRDWKLKDPWAAANADNYRVPFMIHENATVTLRF